MGTADDVGRTESVPRNPHLLEHFAALPGARVVTVPKQLPAAPGGFVGRVAELETLTNLVQQASDVRTVTISVITGMAGVGKTTLAVSWAHSVAEWFADGQLYVNLRGYSSTNIRMTTGEAVRGFLDAFGVAREQLPESLDAQAALYRSLLADKQVLIVLDNAYDAEQVRSLLPGSPGCAVIITSRGQLISLVAAEGAHHFNVRPFADGEARQLLTGRIGPGRVAAEPDSVADIVAFCGGLPLALSIVAARAAVHPEFALGVLAGKLRRSRGRLDAFGSADEPANVRVVFSWSYSQLGSQAARLFRLLGLHPGPDISLPAAASLAALTEDDARNTLGELAQAHMINEHAPDRFALHDLLSTYAAELADQHETEADQEAAKLRVLDHYLHTAHGAVASLYPRWGPVDLPTLEHGVTPEICRGYEQAWAWFDSEWPVLLAVIQQAASAGYINHAWQLSWTLMDYLDRRGYWHDLNAILEFVLDAARSQGDLQGQAHAHEGLGISCRWLGRFRQAEAHLREALDLFTRLDDKIGQADTHSGLVWWFQYGHRNELALEHGELALGLYWAAGHNIGEAHALSDIAWTHALMHNSDESLAAGEEALTLFRALGDRHGEAHTLDTVGYAHQNLGDNSAAMHCYKGAVTLHAANFDRYHQAVALDHLGDIYSVLDNLSAACTAWQQALDILGHIPLNAEKTEDANPDGYPDPDRIVAKLRRSGG